MGTSIFAKWAETDPIIFGLAGVLAASLSAIQRTSKLDERAEAHRIAGSDYGRVRRRADMLRLRLEGQDVTREEGLPQLDQIGEDLSDLARESRALPDKIYNPAKKEFDKSHPEYQ